MKTEAPPLQAQRVIRLGQISAPLLLLAAIVFIVKPPAVDPDVTRPLMIGFSIFFLVVAGALMFVLKPRRDKAEIPQRRFVLNLIGGALAEAVALFGCVIALLGGPIYPALVGIVFTAFVLFVYFPVPNE
ncbi:MAG: hypothetical protein HKN13_08310 [Rhodothermales bacterium]|nr:hypothetical protein [Rhodothermales bacterium]